MDILHNIAEKLHLSEETPTGVKQDAVTHQTVQEHHVIEKTPVVEKVIDQPVFHPIVEKHTEHEENTVHHDESEAVVEKATTAEIDSGVQLPAAEDASELIRTDDAVLENAPVVNETVHEHHVDVVQPVIERTVDETHVHHVTVPVKEHHVAAPVVVDEVTVAAPATGS